MGAWAVETIVGHLEAAPDEPPPAVHKTMPCPLIRRASVAAPAAR
jgi:hypothetical protein